MYRNVILEFLNINQKVMRDNELLQMTIVLFPNNNKTIDKIFKNKENILVYHIKDQYTFSKEYSFNNLNNNILEMALESNESFTANIEDFSFEINDPYYLKDIKNINFNSVEIIPVKENDEVISVVLIYSNLKNVSFKISNHKLVTFINKLNSDLQEEINKKVNELININENYYYVVKSIKSQQYFISDNLNKEYHFNESIIDKKSNLYPRLKKLLEIMKYSSTDDFELYYISKNKLREKSDNLEILLIDVINLHNFKDDYSLIFTKDLDEKLSSTLLAKKYFDAFKKIIPDVSYKCYQIENGSIIFVINSNINKKIENELKFILKKEYYILINIPKDLSKNTNLLNVASYLNEMLPISFNLNDYKSYLENDNYEKYLCDKATLPSKKIMIKADTLETIGEIITGPLENYYKLSTYKIFENATINNLESAINKNLKSPIFTLLVTSITRRKILEQLKRIIIKYPNTKLIIHAPLILKLSGENVFNHILKLKEMGFIIIVDSTIFMNIEFSTSLKIADAVLVRKNECQNSIIESNPYNKCLFNEYYENGKVLIFETIPSETDADLINELTCLVIDKD